MKFAIIAAGEGSRMRYEGVSTPKPLVNIDGRPMIQRLCEIFAQCGAESVHVIVNSSMASVEQFLRTMPCSVPLHIVSASTPSSLHSFATLSQDWRQGKFVLTTVDTIFRADEFERFVNRFRAMPLGTGLMAVTDFIDDEKPLYVEVAGNDITAFSDTDYPGSKYISGGIYALDHAALRVLRDCISRGVSRMRNFQRELLSAGIPLKADVFSKIIDVDHAGDIAAANAMLSGQYPNIP